MKKIEAIIKRSKYPNLVSELTAMGYSIIDKRNLEDTSIIDKQGNKTGSSSKPIPLSKLELVVLDKDAKKVINLIARQSGLSEKNQGKIFISEMEEVVDLDTLNAQQDLEFEKSIIPIKKISKRSRLVPLQKLTLIKLEKIYESKREKLQTEYRIKSFSDFVNYCIMSYLPNMERKLIDSTMVYENRFT